MGLEEQVHDKRGHINKVALPVLFPPQHPQPAPTSGGTNDNMLDLFCTNSPSRVKRINIMPAIADHDSFLIEMSIYPIKT